MYVEREREIEGVEEEWGTAWERKRKSEDAQNT